MLRDLWTNIHSSICSITFSKFSDRIASGSGFKVGNYIITNNHVIQVQGANRITIRFVEADGHTTKVEKKCRLNSFQKQIRDGEQESGWDYAILEMEDSEILALPSLNISSSNEIEIGQDIAVFGFQFEQINQSIHHGTVSSCYRKAGVDYIQLDASINHGNSGGPLIAVQSREVIGIVTRKATGLTEQFDQLIESFDANIQVLQQSTGGVLICGIDQVGSLIASQNQMKRISIELQRSTNVGVGYAYHIRKIRESLELLS